MDQQDETYEEFTKRYRAEQGQPAQGPRITAVNKQLIIMLVGGAIAFAFFSTISSGLDHAVEAEQASHSQPHSNPWAKE
jgi:hypothetical protein